MNCIARPRRCTTAIEPLAQAVARGIEGAGALGRVELGQPDEPGIHRQHVVVEGAGVLERVRPARVETLHQIGAPAKGAKAHAAADIFAERRQVGEDAVRLLQTARRQPRGHHLVEDQQCAGFVRQGAQPGEKGAFGRDAAGGALHRLDQDRRELGAMRPNQSLDRLEIVVAAEQILERRIERAAMAAEIKHAAVIAALEHQNLRPAGDRARGADRHQIGLGAGIGKAHQLDRRKAGADRRGKPRLGRIVRAEIEAAIERRSIALRIAGCEWPNIPAVNSLRKSTYSCPSRSHSRAPSPRTIVSGNGSTWIAERVLPPGIAAQASRCCARLFGLRAR